MLTRMVRLGENMGRSMARMNLAESGRWSGEWWVSGEDKRHQGTLTFSPTDGPVLVLVQGWEYRTYAEILPGLSAQQTTTRDWPVVYGLAGGVRFTLRNVALVSGEPHSGDKLGEMTYRAEVALVGEYVSEEAAGYVSRARFEVENLTQFASFSGIASNWLLDDNDRPTGGGSVSLDLVPLAEFQTREGVTRIHRWYDLPSAKATRRSFTGQLAETVYLDITPDSPVALGYVFALATKLCQLVSLASLDACGVISIQAEVPLVDTELPEGHPHESSPAIVDVLFRPVTIPRPDALAVPVHDYVFTAARVAPEIFLPAWFDLVAEQEPAVGLLTDVFAGSTSRIADRVLAAVSAAESFHRGTNPEPPISDEEHERLLAIVEAAVPDEHKDSVGAKLSDNRHTLRQRLRALFRGLPEELQKALRIKESVWLEEATSARNKVAHSGTAGSAEIEALDAVAEVTAVIVLLHVLRALGVSDADCLTLFHENKRFRRAAQSARKHLV
ncbi:hypothetical protein BMW26_07480 [Microbacterium sp. 1.5R]|nr:hypothetical protein BMW26_07480 [Microbacterium sp. 1.5R]